MFCHKLRYCKLPTSFNNFFNFKQDFNTDRDREKAGNFIIPPPIKNCSIRFPHIEAAKDWNNLPLYLKNITKTKEFKESLTTYLIDKYEDECLESDCYVCNKV